MTTAHRDPHEGANGGSVIACARWCQAADMRNYARRPACNAFRLRIDDDGIGGIPETNSLSGPTCSIAGAHARRVAPRPRWHEWHRHHRDSIGVDARRARARDRRHGRKVHGL